MKRIDCVKNFYLFIKIEMVLAALLFILGYIADVPPAYFLGIILLIGAAVLYYKAHDYVSFRIHSKIIDEKISFSTYTRVSESELNYRETEIERTFLILPKGSVTTTKEIKLHENHDYRIINIPDKFIVKIKGFFLPDYNIFIGKLSPQRNIFPEKREVPYYYITSGGRIKITPAVNSVICSVEGSMRDIDKIEVFLETEDGTRIKEGELKEHGEKLEIDFGVKEDVIVIINEDILSFKSLKKHFRGLFGRGTYKLVFKLPKQELETKIYVEG